MYKTQSVIFIFFSMIVISISSCVPTPEDACEVTTGFDRAGALKFWADEIIIPAFSSYQEQLIVMQAKAQSFSEQASDERLNELRAAWLDAYKAWQKVSMFDIGKAEEIGLRNFTNIYPTNTEMIADNILSESYNLTLPSTFASQGFPALDYLLFGIRATDAEIVELFTDVKYASYLISLTDRLAELNLSVLDDWSQNYRDVFVENSGSSATSSFDKLVNDFLFYYEKFFRAGKIGLPAGVFTGTEMSHLIEAPYSGRYSKELLETAFMAVQDFFNGKNFNRNGEGQCIADFLQAVQIANGGEDLSVKINKQWLLADQKIELLDNNLKTQVETDNISMLETFDELQKAVVILKVEMLQALCIKVDFVDADGD